MWPPGMARSASTSCGIFASMQGAPVGVGGHAGLDRLDQVLVERGEGAGDREPLGLGGVLLEQRGRRVQAEVGQGVRAVVGASPRIEGSLSEWQ